MKNAEPKNRAQLRLMVKAGSILEMMNSKAWRTSWNT